jgi:hypothetical protein
MAISTLDGLIAAPKQQILIQKASRTSAANSWFTTIDLAGSPGAGVLAGTSTSTGVVPVAGQTGFPPIAAFGAGATGYLAGVQYGSTVACRIMVYDLLLKLGAYQFNANVTGQTSASFVSRLPAGDYSGTQLWLEGVTAATGTQSVAVTYTNQAAAPSRTTGTVVTAAYTVGRMIQLPLQAGDSGVSAVNGVVGTVATVGAFNILVVRPLWTGRVVVANAGDLHDYLRVGLPTVYASSALQIAICPDSTATGIPEVALTIANG